MKSMEQENFLKISMPILKEIFYSISSVPKCELNSLEGKQTLLVMVDMVNGFTKEGTLQSERIKAIIPDLVKLSKECGGRGIIKLAFADSHTESSPEFAAYPVHCLAESKEVEIVDELKEVGGYTLVPKNSTNGFLEEAFQKWLKENAHIHTFIVVGNCTDICVQQFAITLKTFFNKQNQKVRVIVPVNCIETYDVGLHQGDLMNVMALYNMQQNGIEIVSEIIY